MIIFDSSFDIVSSGAGTHRIKPIPLNNGKLYLSNACYIENQSQIDLLQISFEIRDILPSEYVEQTI